MNRKSKWRDWGGKWDKQYLQFDDFRKLRPALFPQKDDGYMEHEAIWHARIRSHPTVQVFGLAVCSGCGQDLVQEEIESPIDDEMIKVWSCIKKCVHNRWIRLEPCCNCQMREGRYMIDSRFCRGLAIPSMHGYWSACRACGAYGGPQGRRTKILDPDPILAQVFQY